MARGHRSDNAEHGGHSAGHAGGPPPPRAQLHQLQPRATAPLPAGPLRRRGPDAIASKDSPVTVGADPPSNDPSVRRSRRRLVRLGRADDAELADRFELAIKLIVGKQCCQTKVWSVLK